MTCAGGDFMQEMSTLSVFSPALAGLLGGVVAIEYAASMSGALVSWPG
jgi:hypothetical protein